MTQHHDTVTGVAADAVYSAAARHMHWVTAGAVLVMVPLGLAMTYRGNTLNIWDGLTDALYSTHKLLGFLVLWLVAGRLTYRLLKGAPPDEPTLLWWQKAGSHLLHWLLYGLLLVVPLLGWIGISLYPSLKIFGLFDLPALATPNQDLAASVFLTSPAPNGQIVKSNGTSNFLGTIYADKINLVGTTNFSLDECFVNNQNPALLDFRVGTYTEEDRALTSQ
jgi:cytochrome b561